MRKLDSSGRAEAMQEVRDALHGSDLRIAPQSGTAVRDARAFVHCRRFDEDQSGAPHRKTSEVDEMKVVKQALVGAVRAHRRNNEPAFQGEPPKCRRRQDSGRRTLEARLGNLGSFHFDLLQVARAEPWYPVTSDKTKIRLPNLRIISEHGTLARHRDSPLFYDKGLFADFQPAAYVLFDQKNLHVFARER